VTNQERCRGGGLRRSKRELGTRVCRGGLFPTTSATVEQGHGVKGVKMRHPLAHAIAGENGLSPETWMQVSLV